MSECVVRMEKYENCLDCDLHQIIYGDSYADTDVYCFKEKRYVGKRFGPIKDLARPDWCPIICQLSKGHGRLIDADGMEKEVCSGCVYGEHKYANCIDCALANAPIIVPADTVERSEI